jgi:hypothetical protein
MHGIFISASDDGQVYVAERSGRGSQKLLWRLAEVARTGALLIRPTGLTRGIEQRVGTILGRAAARPTERGRLRRVYTTARVVSDATPTIRTWQQPGGQPEGLHCFSASSSEQDPNHHLTSSASGRVQAQQGSCMRSTGMISSSHDVARADSASRQARSRHHARQQI